MRKNTIRLNEAQLHRVIKESVKQVLNEDASAFGNNLSQLKMEVGFLGKYANQGKMNEFVKILGYIRDTYIPNLYQIAHHQICQQS